MANYLSPFSARQFIDANGNPYSGAQLFTYAAGSSTKVTTYKDSAGGSSHANPIILNTKGEPADGAGDAYPIWQPGSQALKFVLAPSTDTDPPTSPIETWDNISGINDTSVTIDQWIDGPTPTYVSGTQFTLVGDQTSNFHVGRRVKTTNSGGTIYGTITVSAYTSLTTITVVNDSGALDSGLSAVSYGLLSASNYSVPDGMTPTWRGVHTHTKSVWLAEGANVAAATSTNIWAGDGNTRHITGTGGPIDDFATAPQAGAIMHCIADDAFTINDSATIICPGNANLTTAADDTFDVSAETTTTFRIKNYQRASGRAIVQLSPDVQLFTTAGGDTWTKPSGYSSTARVLVEVWGAGGSGALATGVNARAGGGGGGSYKQLWKALGDLSSTESVTIGAGGAGRSTDGDGNNGGSSAFGSYVTAYGGAGGGFNNAGTGEVGGGAGGMRATGTAGAKQNDLLYSEGWGGDGTADPAGVHGFFTGGGGGGAAGSPGAGGSSLYGGGGGGGARSGSGASGGTSTNGGAGSDGASGGTAGSQPGGGGGAGIGGSHNSGAGGDGQVRVTVFPG